MRLQLSVSEASRHQLERELMAEHEQATQPRTHETSDTGLVDHVTGFRGFEADLVVFDESALWDQLIAANPTITAGPARHVQRRAPWWRCILRLER